MASDRGFVLRFYNLFFFSSACSFFGGNTRGKRNERSGNAGKRIGFGIFFKERLLFESIIR